MHSYIHTCIYNCFALKHKNVEILNKERKLKIILFFAFHKVIFSEKEIRIIITIKIYQSFRKVKNNCIVKLN